MISNIVIFMTTILKAWENFSPPPRDIITFEFMSDQFSNIFQSQFYISGPKMTLK